jgi:hypothetical protein
MTRPTRAHPIYALPATLWYSQTRLSRILIIKLFFDPDLDVRALAPSEGLRHPLLLAASLLSATKCHRHVPLAQGPERHGPREAFVAMRRVDVSIRSP